ncbi:MAG: AAA family ATPase [Campylobacterota bacterium]|nr:AAA family ATPase [Campylobacterota bacterium]
MSNKLYKVLDEYIYFDDAYESQEYAKNNPGTTVIRNPDAHESERTYQEPRKQAKMSKSPNMILKYLNEHVISQDKAKKDIALAMYYHSLKSQYSSNTKIGTNGPVMIVGSTGSGKTFIVQKACEYIDTVFIHVDTASMVPEGIVGYSIGNLVADIMANADGDLHRASHCVVFLDEIDKLFHGDNDEEHGARVASQLLRLIEGKKVKISTDLNNTHWKNSKKELDTSNMQFILGGAFQWILDAKSENKTSMGFNNTNSKSSTNEITLEDLYKEEIPKELLGRMSTIVNLQKLSEDDYYKILTNSKSSPLQEFINKVEFHGDQVDISNETLLQISKMAAESELGVRAIKQAINTLFTDALFSTADGEFKTHVIKF